MVIKLIYSPFVKNDLREISDWYNKVDNKLWIQFIKEFRMKIKLIKENPLSFELKYSQTRIVFLKKFSYGIHYVYYKEKNLIEIYSVFHTSRNPNHWTNRE